MWGPLRRLLKGAWQSWLVVHGSSRCLVCFLVRSLGGSSEDRRCQVAGGTRRTRKDLNVGNLKASLQFPTVMIMTVMELGVPGVAL